MAAPPENNEDILLASLVEHVLAYQFQDCSMVLGTDKTTLPLPMQSLVRSQQNNSYRTFFLGRMDPSFSPSYADHPEIWRDDQLYSFRTLPPGMRKPNIWSGGTCAFNMLLASSMDMFPKLTIHVATSFQFRNLLDPVLIHVMSGDRPERLLFRDPAKGITLKLLTHYAKGQLVMHNLCYFCNAGTHTLNKPMSYPRFPIPERRLLFPTTPRNQNGREVIWAHIEDIDMEGARKKWKTDYTLMSYEEYAAVYLERLLNIRIKMVVPQISLEERFSNGTMTGMAGALYYHKADAAMVQFFSHTTIRYNSMFIPLIYFHFSFATRHPNPDMKWYIMFQPYAYEVWVGLCTALILGALSYYFLQKKGNQMSGKEKTRSYMAMLRLVMREFVEQPGPPPGYTSTRTFYAFFCLSSLVIVCGYKAKLVAFLSSPETEILPQNFTELLDSKMAYGTVFLLKTLIAMAVEQTKYKLFERILERLGIETSFRNCFERSLDENFACLMIDYFFKREKDLFLDGNGKLRLLWAPERSTNAYTGPALGNDDINYFQWNFMLRRFFEGAVSAKRRELVNNVNFMRHFYKARKMPGYKDSTDQSGAEVLTLAKVYFILLFYLIGIALACLIFFMEAVSNCCVRKGRNAKVEPTCSLEQTSQSVNQTDILSENEANVPFGNGTKLQSMNGTKVRPIREPVSPENSLRPSSISSHLQFMP